jgi:hypothetical protein
MELTNGDLQDSIIDDANKIVDRHKDKELALTDALHVIQILELREANRQNKELKDIQSAWQSTVWHVIQTGFAALGQWLSQWNPNPNKPPKHQ